MFAAFLGLGFGATLPRAARAQNVVNYGVTLTTASPTFNRPSSTTTLSAVGTSVYYQAQAFTVSAAGAYTLNNPTASLTGTDPYDTYLCLYRTAFTPAASLTNLLAVGDSDATNTTSTSLASISTTLAPANVYYLVSTTFTNSVTGTISSRITGPTGSTVTLIAGSATPEPSSLALTAAVLPLVGFVRRKRRVAATVRTTA